MSKRGLLLIISLLILSFYFTISIFNNCMRKSILIDDIVTNYYEDSNMIIDINYPNTNTRLDNELKNYIDSQINDFKDNYGDSDYLMKKDKMNISYEYKVYNNRYISLVLTTYINSYKINQPIYEVKSYFYDVKEDKTLSVTDILNRSNQLTLFNYIGNQLKTNYYNYIVLDNIENIFNLEKLETIPFFINNDNIIVYFTPDSLASDYYDILTIEVPISLIEFNI